MLPIISFAEDAPNKNDEGMKKVLGIIADTNQVQTSRKGGALIWSKFSEHQHIKQT